MTCNTDDEELADYSLGELAPVRQTAITAHVQACPACRQRLVELAHADALLQATPRYEPGDAMVLELRRSLAEVVRPARLPQVLSPNQVAEFLAIPLEDVYDILPDIPAFRIGLRVRVRREKLLAWVEAQERSYAHASAASWVQRGKAVVA